MLAPALLCIAPRLVQAQETPEAAPDTTQPDDTPEATSDTTQPDVTPEATPDTTQPDDTPEATPDTTQPDDTPEATPDDADEDEPARAVLRFGSVEIAPDLKLYADYQLDVGSEELENAFHLTRAYLGIRANITSWLSARVTYDISQATDIGRDGELIEDDGESVVDGSRVQGSLLARLKYAYVNFEIERLSLSIRFGVLHTPWMGWIEHIENTRFLRKVMLENEYHYPSADFGVGITGHIRDYLAYFVGVYNGEGYHGIEDTRFKDVIGRLSLRPFPGFRPLSALQLSGYAQVEMASGDEQETHRRYGGALTYRYAESVDSADCSRVSGERFALWFQAFYGQDGLSDAFIESFGFSVGGRVELPANLFILSRLDRFDADLSASASNSVYWTIIGAFGYRPFNGVIVALDYQGRIGPGDDRHLIGLHVELHL